MTVKILVGDVLAMLATLADDSVDCVVTSPPYWGLRDYGVEGQIGLERTLGEHLAVMIAVFREVRRVLKPTGTLWLNYGDCYATTPNGRSAADTKAAGNDDRTFRDKPFSTIGPIHRITAGEKRNDVDVGGWGSSDRSLRWRGGGVLKPKDLCMIPNRLAIALQEDGWWVRSEIIWHKPNPMPESIRDRPTTSHEKVFLLTKAERYFYNQEAVLQPASPNTHARLAQNVQDQIGSTRANGGAKTNGNMKAVSRKQDGHSRRHDGFNDRYFGKDRKLASEGQGIKNNDSFDAAMAIMPTMVNLRNVWSIPTLGFKEAHFATFPPELVERCLLAGCPAGGLVLDPFGGAGTTGLVADRLARDAILIELNPEYAEMARRRIHGDAPLFVDVQGA